MKIFISLKVPRGDPELEQLADLVESALRAAGHDPFVATREIARMGFADPKDFMCVVRQQVQTCDLMIVLYHPELRGGLIEMGLAYAHHIPIWLCYKMGDQGDKFNQHISSSARGCADLTITYTSLVDLQRNLTAYLCQDFQRE